VCAQIATSKIRFIWFPASIREVTTKPKHFEMHKKLHNAALCPNIGACAALPT
jgi:hypothetical protein